MLPLHHLPAENAKLVYRAVEDAQTLARLSQWKRNQRAGWKNLQQPEVNFDVGTDFDRNAVLLAGHEFPFLDGPDRLFVQPEPKAPDDAKYCGLDRPARPRSPGRPFLDTSPYGPLRSIQARPCRSTGVLRHLRRSGRHHRQFRLPTRGLPLHLCPSPRPCPYLYRSRPRRPVPPKAARFG